MNKFIGIIVAAFIALLGEIALYFKGKSVGKKEADNANLAVNNQVLQKEVDDNAKIAQVDNVVSQSNADTIVDELCALNPANKDN